MKDIAQVDGIKAKVKRGTFIRFIFLNANMFEKSVMDHIQDACCKFVFTFEFGFVTGLSYHELYKECTLFCSFERDGENSFDRM